VQHLTAQDADDAMSSWIDPVFVVIPEDSMAAVTVENAAGTVALERDADLRWQLAEGAPLPAGKTAPVSIDQKAVSAITGKLAKIEIETAVGTEAKPEFGLGEPTARITVGMASQGAEGEAPAREVRIIEIGAKIGGSYHLRILDKPHIVTVKEEALKELVDLAIDELVDEAAPPPVAPQP